MTTVYSFDEKHRFRLEGYNRAKPFASFLPGIAGVNGTPMWVFYVNRGQGIASFGVQDKDSAIMEFYPANKSYQLTPTVGFRTFVKWEREGRRGFWEPFSGTGKGAAFGAYAAERMTVAPNGLKIDTESQEAGLAVQVEYFTIPGEDYAALVRHVTIRNTGGSPVKLELLDGLPAILPYGMSNAAYKELGHTLKSWMDVYNLDQGIPFYKVRGSTADSAEVSEVTAGHFYLSFVSDGESGERRVRPIVDAEAVFGADTTFREPEGFLAGSLESLTAEAPITTNKVPCGFSGLAKELPAGAAVEICSLVGHTTSIDRVNRQADRYCSLGYIQRKKAEAEKLAEVLTDPIGSRTAMPLFDAYARQCFLDNVLRGGYPLLIGKEDKKKVYHVYSRKHGDLERDYNFFSLQPAYYSQGNGNFRDVNQNRRSDLFFEPEVGDFNVKLFMELIQADGYNPLVVKGSVFRLEDASKLTGLLELVEEQERSKVSGYLTKSSLTPGGLLKWLLDEGVALRVPAEEFMAAVISESEQDTDAVFGEGCWSDHWTYNMDQIETYLAVYPERLKELLFGDRSYRYYESPAYVLPRSEKYVLAGEKVRQYGALLEDEAKHEAIAARGQDGSWVRVGHGAGEVYRTNLYEKLLFLAVIKFSTLDPYGLGVEMEAGKPGWNDSLNGLPGLFGSGFSETCELRRLVQFLLDSYESVRELNLIALPVEIAQLLERIEEELALYSASGAPNKDYVYWDRVSVAREQYREAVRYGFSGDQAEISLDGLNRLLQLIMRKLEQGFDRALELGDGIYPTYFYYEAESWQPLKDESGAEKRNGKGQVQVRVESFRVHTLPPFLEGVVRAMKVIPDEGARRRLYEKVKESGIYDRKLRMYKVNASLEEETFELGRTRAFTPGWLENESVFLHMEYKYLLELLKSGLYEPYFEDMQHALIPFLDPQVYGRSTLENSSFIASSANPDSSLHGTGYVARLSGSTAEFLQMWQIMMAGRTPFMVRDGELSLELRPVLPGWMFDSNGEVSFRFLNSCEITYVNRDKADTFGIRAAVPASYSLSYQDGMVAVVQGPSIGAPYAADVRNRRVKAIRVKLQ